MNIKTVHQSLSLMGLPGEIRNKIYRELLRSEKCLTKRSNPVFEDSESESEPWTEVHKPHGEASTIQGVSPWLARYEFQTAILRVNSQIHKEAIGILYNDNLWVAVTVNDPLFSENMKAAGFPVICCSPVDHITKSKSSLKVAIRFPYNTKPPNDMRAFLLAHDSLPGLVRALWLTRGMRDLVVALDLIPVVHPQYTKMIEEHLLAPFEQLKGIKRLFVLGTTQEKRSELQ
ncbi:MAG: hypothetical protein M1836_003914 [Candelina mexicana]|nr:MAG: hypothetical protein M1836_003914 [Candelina mexicana]